MKLLLVYSLTLLLALSTCLGQTWLDPDQYNEMLEREEARRRAAGLQIPTYMPTLQTVNDIDSSPPVRNNGGFQAAPFPNYQPVRSISKTSAAYAAPTPSISAAAVGVPSTNPFDTFLPARWRDHVINILSRGITKFALDMDRAIEKSQPGIPDNLLFSPVSLTTTLAMVMLASGGKTFDEVARILGLESGIDVAHHSEVVHQVFGLLLNQANRMSKMNPDLPQSKFAFGIFVEDGYPVRSEFRDVSEKVYNSEVISVDFSHRNVEAQKVINDWVSNRTEGKIKNMLMDAPSPMTDVIITSALYFSGEWQNHFFVGGTKRKAFTVNDNETIYADMMVNGGDFPFYEDKKLGARIIALPYKGNEVSMYAMLPTEKGTQAVKDLKGKLTPEVIEDLIGNMKNSSCIIAYPKMKLSSTLRMQSALEALGLKSLFDPKTADLSLLSPGRDPAGHRAPAPPSSSAPPAQNSGPRNPAGHNAPPPPSSSAPPAQNSEPRKPTPPFNGGFKQPVKTLRTDPDFSFPSRFGGVGAKNNFYRYDDEVNGYMIEQWGTGYHIEKSRRKRQIRPIDREFIDFLNHQKLPNFGVDDLRNTAGLSNPGLFADDVIHKVEMTVNEKGTEAAAATSVILDRSGDYKRFIANRPFLFFIRHNTAKSILFWGTINRPAPFYKSL